jgi:hypothetical protein
VDDGRLVAVQVQHALRQYSRWYRQYTAK